MTIIDAEYIYASLSLTTPGWTISALGAIQQITARRGDNVVTSGRTGRIWVPKKRDESKLTLIILVKDYDFNGSGNRGPGYLQQNIDILRGTFARDGLHYLKQISPAGTRTILAEVKDRITLVPIGPYNYKMAVTFTMPFPYWRDENQHHNHTWDVNDPEFHFLEENNGTAPCEDAIFRVWGACAQPQFFANGIWFRYNGVLSDGEYINVFTGEWKCTRNGNIIENDMISHGGDIRWMIINPGGNDFIFTVNSATFPLHISVQYYSYFV